MVQPFSQSLDFTENKGFLNPKKVLAFLDIKKRMKAADFGCGSGYFPIALSKAVGESGKVTAIDVLKSALELVMARAKNDRLFNVSVVRANLEISGSSGLSDDSEDMVLLVNILHQSDKKDEILKEAKRVVISGGEIIVIDYYPKSLKIGPQKEQGLDKGSMKKLAEANHLNLIKEFEASDYHWGMIFTK